MLPEGTMGRAAILAVSLLLAWRIIQVNAVSFDDTGRPRLPTLRTASEVLPDERRPLEQAALEHILDGNPGEVAALLMIAGELAAAGETARATEAYRAALELAPVDRQVLSLAGLHLLRMNDPRGLESLSRLVGHYPAARPQAFPLLAQTLAAASHQAAWKGIVSRNPPWLGAFVADSCARGIDPALLVPLLLGRPGAGKGTPPESACVIDRLRSDDRWEESYHLWLSLLPRERLASVGFVFNGSFEQEPSGIGFDWTTQQGAEKQTGHVAEIVPTQGAAGRRALRVAYNGKRQAGVPARQFLALAPGDYELNGLVRTQGIRAVRGIQWKVRCVGKGKPLETIASSERFIGSGEWRPFSMAVTVGASCTGQVLQLEPADGEGSVAFIAGIAWFDDLLLTRR